MNPTPDALAAIRAEDAALGGPAANPTPAALAAALNAPTLPNPAGPPAQVPAPLDEDALLAALASDAAGVDRLNAYPHLDHVLANLADGDLPSLRRWLTLLTGGTTPVIAADHAAAIRGALTATVPDPSWPARVSWASIHLGRPADGPDCAAAREAD